MCIVYTGPLCGGCASVCVKVYSWRCTATTVYSRRFKQHLRTADVFTYTIVYHTCSRNAGISTLDEKAEGSFSRSRLSLSLSIYRVLCTDDSHTTIIYYVYFFGISIPLMRVDGKMRTSLRWMSSGLLCVCVSYVTCVVIVNNLQANGGGGWLIGPDGVFARWLCLIIYRPIVKYIMKHCILCML